MRKGDLVKWDDPGKDAIGVVLANPDGSLAFSETRIPVSWFSDAGVRVSHPLVRDIKLVEPRKVNS
jgi:hypothetical protein